ncbi:hypothetical protein Pyn_39493 [Prunus yedoensis var. nudiflora]|uniref:Uncharacterized protein n=1 Tax=Prunus yedoensis var. nudiflora TaxID=2094558 RepID=A0A314V141_PRUYE|nr:hypothetical protein Pyn_39493 [Prunus yedoensis var. nudiflora]
MRDVFKTLRARRRSSDLAGARTILGYAKWVFATRHGDVFKTLRARRRSSDLARATTVLGSAK